MVVQRRTAFDDEAAGLVEAAGIGVLLVDVHGQLWAAQLAGEFDHPPAAALALVLGSEEQRLDLAAGHAHETHDVAAVNAMLPSGNGRILHVASIAGKEGNAGMLAYSATKAGLIGMVKSAGKDYAETGITINALAPAVIRTDMVAAMPDHQVKYMTDRIPMKRTGELDEAAAMIDFIVSPECSFTTGFTFAP